jgi:hypothetical protein
MSPEDAVSHFSANLAIATGMIALTVVIHFAGLLALTLHLRGGDERKLDGGRHVLRRFATILVVVLGIFFVHTLEIWAYAMLYRYPLGIFDDFETALYFSTQSFVALGYGDIQVPRAWRLIGAIEAANGLILIGWSTAFLISVMARLRSLEHEWLDHDRG